MTSNSNHFAVVVGIDHYPDFQNLNGAKRDAQAFAQWLENTDGGCLPTDNIKLVLSEKTPLQPIQDHVDDALADIIQCLNGQTGKRLYIYFSGHGLARSHNETDLCLAKWSRLKRGCALDSNDYLNLLVESGWFEEVLIFLDCCRIRQIRSRALPSTLDITRPANRAAQTKYMLANATEYMAAAFEGGVDDNDTIRGFFTTALLEGLQGHGTPAQQDISLANLRTYLLSRVNELANVAGHRQIPQFLDNISDDSHQIIFGKARAINISKTQVVITFSDGEQGEFYLENGDLEVIATHNAEQGSWSIELERGLYSIANSSNGSSTEVKVKGDEEIAINVQI